MIARYYQARQFISTSFAPNATTGVYATLKGDPEFPRGLSRKQTETLVRKLQREGALVSETYKRSNRSHADRWAVTGPPAGAG